MTQKRSIGFFIVVLVLSFLLANGCTTNTGKPKISSVPASLSRESFVDPDTGMEFVKIMGGCFVMGSPDSEIGRDMDEGPTHHVCVSTFFLSKYETTQSQWEKIMNGNPSRNKSSGALPVECVSWNDVHKFIDKVNSRTGYKYRLPTEAEWEYACRAGIQTPFASGKDELSLSQVAWFSINSGGESHRIGTLMPNSWNIYDMHGNVCEWVEDGMRGYLPRDENNPIGELSLKNAICRGGSWLHPARLCRSANRMVYEKRYRSEIIGFRLAISVDRVDLPK